MDSHNKISKRKNGKGRKRKFEISREELEKYFKYSQSKAAALLNVSVSTLKRRFYQLDMGKRWPYNSNPERTTWTNSIMISCLLHEKDIEDPRIIDHKTWFALQEAFSRTAM